MPRTPARLQAANLLRALRQNKEAAGLGLLEGVKGERAATDIEVGRCRGQPAPGHPFPAAAACSELGMLRATHPGTCCMAREGSSPYFLFIGLGTASGFWACFA